MAILAALITGEFWPHLVAGRADRLNVGFLATAVLSAFRQAAPDAGLRLTEADSQDLLDTLGRGELDVAFARPPAPNPELATSVVWHEPVIAALPADHPLSASLTERARQLR